MTPRREDSQKRKEHILGIVVNEYIRNVSPVSSGLIKQKYRLDVSSATIRNILADLEKDGLLTHPHTSAGRMPTEEGYRYYVDYLMNEISLLEDQKQRIKAEYEQERKNLERILEKTSELVSDLTHYTSIVSVEDHNGRVFCNGARYVVDYADYQDLKKIQEILTLLEHKEEILALINRELRSRIQIFIGHELACRNIEDCSMAVSQYTLSNGRQGRIAVLGPKRMNYQKVVSALDYMTHLMREIF